MEGVSVFGFFFGTLGRERDFAYFGGGKLIGLMSKLYEGYHNLEGFLLLKSRVSFQKDLCQQCVFYTLKSGCDFKINFQQLDFKM